jgi:hypothetical protein
MKQMQHLFLLFAVFYLASSSELTDTKLEFKSKDNSVALRTSIDGSWTIPNLFGGVYWNSLEVRADNNSLKSDYIWGIVATQSGRLPINWLAYFSATSEAHRSMPDDPSRYDWLNFTVNQSSGFLASTFLGLTELNATTGEEVETMSFKSGFWNYNTLKSTQMSNEEAGIIVAVFDFKKLNQPNFLVELVYVMTQQAGTLNLETSPYIVPKAVESFITISGWGYEDKANQLQLTMACGTAEAKWDASGSVSAGNGDDATFFHVASEAVADGKVSKVGIEAEVSVNGLAVFENPSVTLQLQARYAAKATAHVIKVKFPAGAGSITYDPSTGVGNNPYQPTGSDAGMIVGIVFGCLAVVIALTLGLYCFVQRKRKGYENVQD